MKKKMGWFSSFWKKFEDIVDIVDNSNTFVGKIFFVICVWLFFILLYYIFRLFIFILPFSLGIPTWFQGRIGLAVWMSEKITANSLMLPLIVSTLLTILVLIQRKVDRDNKD